VLKDGFLLQCASPRELFTRPANVFVAGFIGSPAMNLAGGTVSGDAVHLAGLDLPLRPDQRDATTSASVTIGVRPEGFDVVGPGEPGIEAVIDVVEELGSDTYLYADAGLNGEPVRLTVRREGLSSHTSGEKVTLRPLPGALHLFDTATGARLPD
jgi:multiple sugar transport system ATP-binding protein